MSSEKSTPVHAIAERIADAIKYYEYESGEKVTIHDCVDDTLVSEVVKHLRRNAPSMFILEYSDGEKFLVTVAKK